MVGHLDVGEDLIKVIASTVSLGAVSDDSRQTIFRSHSGELLSLLIEVASEDDVFLVVYAKDELGYTVFCPDEDSTLIFSGDVVRRVVTSYYMYSDTSMMDDTP